MLVKQYYLNMIAVATGDDPRQERAEAELETFEEDTKEMLEVRREHVHNVIFCFAKHGLEEDQGSGTTILVVCPTRPIPCLLMLWRL